MRILPFLTACAVMSALIGGCTSEPEPPPFRVVATVDQLMDYVVTPAAMAYWGSVSIIVDERGITENYPSSDEEWEDVVGAAIALAESGNLLMMSPRAVDDGEWMQLAAAMVEAAITAAAAAEAKDPDQVFDAGEIVYNTCEACHERYLIDPSALTFPPMD